MTALPATVAPLRALPTLPALTVAATAALDVEPTELIARWLANLSPTARRSYRRSLARFAAWSLADDAAPEAALRFLCSLDVGRAGELVRGWHDELLASGLSSGSVCGYCTALCSLLGACRRAGLVAWKLEAVQPKYEARHDRRGPRRGDVERLFAVVDEAAAQGDPQAVRDCALLRTLYVAAFRRSEAAGLRYPEDVELAGDAGPTLRPRRKGHTERKAVTVTQRCADAIARWLDVRGREPGPLFVRLRGRQVDSGPLNGETVRRLVRSWAKRAGIRGTVRPHGLRHSSASTVAKNGSLSELLALGQWSSLSAAKRYIDEHSEERASALRLVDL